MTKLEVTTTLITIILYQYVINRLCEEISIPFLE